METVVRTKRQKVISRLPGLDGLRGIAVLAVIIYHADISALAGGFLGVDVFFVLSGFLITNLLLEELTRTNTIDRANFYLRRIRRLLPALLLVLIADFLFPTQYMQVSIADFQFLIQHIFFLNR